jgi:hypothetical protein
MTAFSPGSTWPVPTSDCSHVARIVIDNPVGAVITSHVTTICGWVALASSFERPVFATAVGNVPYKLVERPDVRAVTLPGKTVIGFTCEFDLRKHIAAARHEEGNFRLPLVIRIRGCNADVVMDFIVAPNAFTSIVASASL